MLIKPTLRKIIPVVALRTEGILTASDYSTFIDSLNDIDRESFCFGRADITCMSYDNLLNALESYFGTDDGADIIARYKEAVGVDYYINFEEHK